MSNLFKNPEKIDKPRWKVSGAWARKPINCTLHGILNECNGCCSPRPKGWVSETKYPMSSFNSGTCGHFIEGTGCKFTLADRPLNCMLYPFVLNPSKTLVLTSRSLCTSCKPAYKTQDKSIFEIAAPIFKEIFGDSEYQRVYNDVVVQGKDFSYFYPTEHHIRIMEEENRRESLNIQPTNRNDIT